MKSRMDSALGRLGGLRAVAVVVLTVVLAIPATVSAQAKDEEDVSDETAKKVLTLLRDGKELYEDEEYQKAYDKFQEAYDLWPRPAIQARLGKAAEQLGNQEKALEHYRAYLEKRPEGKMADKVRANAEELREEMSARISVRSIPSGATVYLGEDKGEELGTTPLESEVDPGSQVFVIEADGYESATRTYEMKAGKDKSVTVELTRSSEKPKAFGGSGQMGPDKTDTGGGAPRRVPDTTQTLAIWGWTTGIIGLAGLGTGGMFAYLKGQTTDDVNSLNRGAPGTTRQGLEDLKGTARRHHRTSLIAFSIGGAMTAVGGGLLLQHYLGKGKTGAKKADADVKFDVGFTANGGWAGVQGEF